ncbi:MAG: DUF1223 domain-containing protein [Rhodospirillales bacterium]|nr:DUF1223 domain-containing protein [Rhodospirillales bacterium]
MAKYLNFAGMNYACSSFRRLSLAALITGVWLALSISVSPAFAAERSPTVVELYTSQGCSSCPPSDAMLARLSKRGDILALSFHVDYWDYIGWKDPFARPENTQRQHAYKRMFNRSYVYTPQMVIHGLVEMTGSNLAQVNSGIEKSLLSPDVSVELVRNASGGLKVSIGRLAQPAQASIYLAFFDRENITKVRRGENRGATITNVNVVREFKKIGEWHGAEMTVEVAAEDLEPHAGRGCAVFLQSAQTGPILGSAEIDLKPQK